jgi:L-ascorbate metabolism protein UlaG (beta-lactamase superfamily)
MTTYIDNPQLLTIKKSWEGNRIIDGEFTNGTIKDNQIVPLDILKWKLSKNPQQEEKKKDDYKLKVIKNNRFAYSKEDMIVWLGHATFFIRLNGTTFITDPILNNLSMMKRLAGLPCKVSDLKNIDFVLLSHGHRDHFDKKSIKQLYKNNTKIEALIPLNLGRFFKENKIPFQEAAWYQKYKTDKDVEIYFMPAKHWNRRGLTDFNKNLWGSFVIRSGDKSLFFAGDTSHGEHFKEIAEFFPNIDYCLMPIGAYKPEYLMKQSHLSPYEALKAFKDLGGKTFVPMHFATFDLADEPIGEPVRIIKKERQNLDIRILDVGEELLLNNNNFQYHENTRT